MGFWYQNANKIFIKFFFSLRLVFIQNKYKYDERNDNIDSINNIFELKKNTEYLNTKTFC